ncbi:hypothetical protein FH972_012342 [Carpinus fangiana]|uniref:Uncharacterized protein n=1 Tax=Carpinus fangiana TaxID=176857 RepID=A0A5N6R6V8_9ROSI|nr:hypothetical protein FH972_012342 [Carpinus fangiana]
MNFNSDLRYVVPAVISIFFVVLPSEDNHRIQRDILGIPSLEDPIFVMMVFLVLAGVISVLLFTSVNLPLTLERPLIYLQIRHFSLSFALSLLASLIFPPSQFWLFFPILVIISPWDKKLLGLLLKFYNTLQALPARIILCFPQRDHQEESEPVPHNQLAVQVIENEGSNTRY